MAHILIVDDEATIRFLIRTLLESAGHSVFEAKNGRAALAILETFPRPFDIVTLDIYMPYMNGFEFLSILQNQPIYPVVLIISAHSDPIPQTVVDKIGGRLTKPFRRQELITMVNRLVNQSLELPSSHPTQVH